MKSVLNSWLILHTLPLLICVFLFVACDKQDDPILPPPTSSEPLYHFQVDQNFILNNNVPLDIRGMVYVPVYPGHLPWEMEPLLSLPIELQASISTDLKNIKSLGANTVRFWGAPVYCYEALENIGDLYFLQTIWIDDNVPDFHDPEFKENTKAYIRSVIDRIYSVFTKNDIPLIAWIVGNELSESSLNSTNAAHPGINSFTGNHIIAASPINATEAFIAEMADYVKSYETSTYGNTSLVTYANDIRTADLLDTPFLDFRCHNSYSYAIPFFRPNTQLGSTTGTLFQGWIEELKSQFPDLPLLITETGFSVSPGAVHIGPPNYGYGGNTEFEQANGLVQNLNDIETANRSIAGVCIHEYLDAWWKFGLEDSFSQDPNDVEEWFGLTKFKKTDDWYTTTFRESYTRIKEYWSD